MVVRLGIIGLSADQAAWATLAHVQALKPGGSLADQYKLTALATSNPESAKAAAKAHGLPPEKAYSSPEDIANDPEVDMVVVSVKVPMHKELTMPALHAKKDVFVEWPLGNGLAEAEEMAAFAKKQGVKAYAKEIISSGALGRITSTTVSGTESQLIDLPEKYRYLNTPGSGASVISVPVAHYIDVILYVLSSELSSLSATATTTYPTVSFISPTTGEKSAPEPKRFADNVAISGVLTPGGGVLSFHLAITSPATPPTFQCIICGEKGALKMEGKSPAVQLTPPTLYFAEAPEGGEQKGTYDSREGGAEWREVEVPKSGMAGLFGGVAEVYEAIAAGKGVAEGIVDFDEAVKRHRMVEAVERSAIEGRRESYL